MKFPGGGGGMNMQAMMKQAQAMQQRMLEQIDAVRVEASAGGGMVTVKMDGKRNLLDIKISAEAAGDAEMLQDMILAAFNEAGKKVETETQKISGAMLGGMGLPPGLL